jgi:hypothetical protein
MQPARHFLQRFRQAALLLLLFGIGRAALAATLPFYTVERLGDPGGPTAINDLGQVAGGVRIPGGTHAALWSLGGVATDLDTRRIPRLPVTTWALRGDISWLSWP